MTIPDDDRTPRRRPQYLAPAPGDQARAAGTWWYASDGDLMLSCPECGTVFRLRYHHIAEDGAVAPAVMCPAPCGFHAYVVLGRKDPGA